VTDLAVDRVRTIRPVRPIDRASTLGPLSRGRGDPTTRVGPGEVWRATRTPDGVATTRVTAGAGAVTMQAWGPGSAWAIEHLPALVGDHDDDSGFVPLDPVVADLARRTRGLRMCRTDAIVEALVPSVIEQKVIGLEARRSYARLVRALGAPAPGPAGGLFVPPEPAVLAGTPADTYHRFGIERTRSDAIRLACSYARRLEEAVVLPPDAARARLRALPGIGPWTAAEVTRIAFGDADAVSVGDYHLPSMVAWALAGEPRADDARMLELLAPYAGHRARVVRMIEIGGSHPPRSGPRLPLRRDFDRLASVRAHSSGGRR
jgi:3-methyladenine DNA glycosylase/8-oxoguanine DNA glycosylase